MTKIEGNPYVGPRTFRERHADRFFGRDREALDLLSLVVSRRLVLFYAQSGAGKSSLINTRLRPWLVKEGFVPLPTGRVGFGLPEGIDEVDNIFAFSLRHGLDRDRRGDASLYTHMPLAEFLAHLTEEGGGYGFDPGVSRSSGDRGPGTAPRVLIVDQFEEILTTHPERWQEREPFFHQLAAAMHQDDRLWVVLSLRDDWVTRLEPFLPLLPRRLQGRFYMQRLDEDAAMQAVREPARLAGRPFAPGVAANLVENLQQMRIQGQDDTRLGQYVEAVGLQIVCHGLWERVLREAPDAEEISAGLLAGYDVDQALTQFYETAIAEVAAQGKVAEDQLREWIQGKLITPDGTRGTVYRGEQESAGLPTTAAEALVGKFLLRTEERASATWYELVHDRFVEPIRSANEAAERARALEQRREAQARERELETELLQKQETVRQLTEQVFEITIQRRSGDLWPVVAELSRPGSLPVRVEGTLALDPDLPGLELPPREYGAWLGRALFRESIRDHLLRAHATAAASGALTRLLLNVEDHTLGTLRWERLCAPLLGRRWDPLVLNPRMAFSQFLPSAADRRFPPLGRRDLRALVLISCPDDLGSRWDLAPFDVDYTEQRVKQALGQISSDLLSPGPTLEALCERLGAGSYTLLHIVCHARASRNDGKPVLFLADDEGQARPELDSELINCLRYSSVLPHLVVLDPADTAEPEAMEAMIVLARRLVRELGLPAAVVLSEKLSREDAEVITGGFYRGLVEHGEPDRAIAQAFAGLPSDLGAAIPVLYSRLAGRPLFTEALDRPLTGSEIEYGQSAMERLLPERAPVLLDRFAGVAGTLSSYASMHSADMSETERLNQDRALAEVNNLCEEACDLSFNALALGQAPPAYDARCPFRGLAPFGSEDREFFFGREALVEQLEGRLQEHDFLALIGPSGCGKTSLALAGLIPALETTEPEIAVAYLTPGREPVAQLEAGLAQGNAQPVLLVVDQFEELFTLCDDEAERQAFLDRLLGLVGRMPVLIILRADFYGECLAYGALADLFQTGQVNAPTMDSDELRLASELQASAVGLRFEAGLLNTMLDDVRDEPGAMPLLQHALRELWERRHGRWLRVEEYRAIGGVRQALAGTAEAWYERLTPEDQSRVQDIFLRLTRLVEERDIRRRVACEELVPAGDDPAETLRLIGMLADARLVVVGLNEASGREEVEVAHEALIRNWPRLRDWLAEHRASLELREAISQAAWEWEAGGRDESFLVLQGARLAEAEALTKEPRFALNELEQRYLETSVARRERMRAEAAEQQRRELEQARLLAEEQSARAAEQAAAAHMLRLRARILAFLGVAAALMAVAATFLAFRARESGLAAEQAAVAAQATGYAASTAQALAETAAVQASYQYRLSQSRALASESTSTTDQDLAVLLGLEAVLLTHDHEPGTMTSEAAEAVHQAMARSQWQAAVTVEHGGPVEVAAWNPEGARFVTAGWDDVARVWEAATGQELFVLAGHSGDILDAAWSPDLQRIATASSDATVIVWDAQSGEALAILEGHAGAVLRLGWSPDGSRILTAGQDGTARIWDLVTEEPLLTLSGHQGPIYDAVWSPDGADIATAGEDGTARIWDARTGAERLSFTRYVEAVVDVAWSPDGSLVATASADGTARVWDPTTGEQLQRLSNHQDRVRETNWSPDGTRLVTASDDGTARIWDAAEGKEIFELSGHAGAVNRAAWGPAAGRIVTAGEDGTARVWDAATGTVLVTLSGHEDPVGQAVWSPDGGRILTASLDGTARVWEEGRGATPFSLRGHTWIVFSAAWSPDGTRIATASDDGTARVWDAETGAELSGLRHEGPLWDAAWSPDGRRLVTVSEDGTARLWDPETGAEISGLRLDVPIWDAAWSPDGTQIATASADGTVLVWAPETGAELSALGVHGDQYYAATWSPDGSRLATVDSEGATRVWDVDTGEELAVLDGHEGWVAGAAWSPDGRHIVTAGDDGTARVWDVDTGEELAVLDGHEDWVNGAVWSPDGNRIVTAGGDSTARVWSAETGNEILLLAGHDGPIRTAAWSPDGDRIATAGEDGTAKVWDAKTGAELITLTGHTATVWEVSWSPDGKRLVTASEDTTARIYYVTIDGPGGLIEAACASTDHNLTQAEWQRYLPGVSYRQTCPGLETGE